METGKTCVGACIAWSVSGSRIAWLDVGADDMLDERILPERLHRAPGPISILWVS